MFVALIEFIIEAVTSARCIRIQLKRARVIANIDASSQKATEISLLFPPGAVGARRGLHGRQYQSGPPYMCIRKLTYSLIQINHTCSTALAIQLQCSINKQRCLSLGTEFLMKYLQ